MPAEFDPLKRTLTSEATAEPVADDMEHLFSNREDERIWSLLSIYVDGEASSEEMDEVETLLSNDATYARAYDFMLETGGAIRTIEEIEPPADLRDLILSRTTRRPTLWQRVSTRIAAFQSQLALPNFMQSRKMAIAGSGFVAVGLVAGVISGKISSHPDNDGGQIASTTHREATGLPQIGSDSVSRSDSSVASNSRSHLILPRVDDDALTRPSTPGYAVQPVRYAKPEMSSKPNSLSSLSTSATYGVKQGSLILKNRATSALVHLNTNSRLVADNSDRIQGPNHLDDDRTNHGVNPMMENGNTGNAKLAMLPSDSGKEMSDDDNLNDRPFVPITSNDPNMGMTDGAADQQDPPSGVGHRIEARIIVSKLPPIARHILSPGEVARQVSNTVPLNLTSSTDAPSRRPAEVKIISTKF